MHEAVSPDIPAIPTDALHGRDEYADDTPAVARARKAAGARKVSGRRRLVDPTTCDRDYSDAELEFMEAMQRYKQRSGRMFPTWSEVLEVLKSLGYEKPPTEGDGDPGR